MEKNIDYVALGRRIKNKRIENNLTQEQLGELCKLSSAHIGHIERGTRILSVDVLFIIAQKLNVSVDYLLFDSVEDNNILNSIAPILKDTDKSKVNSFLNTVRVLAENINEL